MTAKCWHFTINNPTAGDEQALEAIRDDLDGHNVRYIIVGLETAPTTGTPHYQGYVQFKSRVSRKVACERLGNRANVLIARGTAEDNQKYCSKDGNWAEAGEPQFAGERTDLTEVKEMVEKGVHIGKIMKMTNTLQASSYAEKYAKYHAPRRTWKTWAAWIWGPSGCGKTNFKAKDMYLSVKEKRPEIRYFIKKVSTGKWWDGYDGQEFVVIDDVRKGWAGSGYSFMDILGYCGEEELMVEIKGGVIPFVAKWVVFTSVKPPWEEMKDPAEDIQQLKRRLERVVKMEPRLEEPVYSYADDHVEPRR